ncbi:MAG TPA: GRP family sugar transporter [Gemmatimonadaceae bacterium]|nr:GRP family sugar transporter [Gemmatimonadaceae bacterium]
MSAVELENLTEERRPVVEASRLRTLQNVGMLCGLTAGAWLGAAEAPTKLVTLGLSPVVISLTMVVGVFLARWTLPALIQGTAYIAADLRQAPHLIIWAILAGCLWAVANTLTIFAVRDVGLSIAFPLWNSNSLLGIIWGIVFFKELHGAESRRWAGVIGGALLMFAGATALAIASASQVPARDAARGVVAALSAGVLWGTMYIPYRKAYLTGMSPLSFVTFFTVGELGMMTILALTYSGGAGELWTQLSGAKHVLFWLLAGGFIWVIGDLFQQYAVKYAGITRGIPLSNTNQLWGLLWGILVFGELRSAPGSVLAQVVGGSLVMAIGAGIIAASSVDRREHARWQEAAEEEGSRYKVKASYTQARIAGEAGAIEATRTRRPLDWIVVGVATAIIVAFALIARSPQINIQAGWALALIVATLAMLVGVGSALWRATRFN